jgi:hypothetical protein
MSWDGRTARNPDFNRENNTVRVHLKIIHKPTYSLRGRSMIRLVFSAFFGVTVGFGLSCNAQSAYNVQKNDARRTGEQIEDANKQNEKAEQTPPAPKRIQTFEEYMSDQWTEFDKMSRDRN